MANSSNEVTLHLASNTQRCEGGLGKENKVRTGVQDDEWQSKGHGTVVHKQLRKASVHTFTVSRQVAAEHSQAVHRTE